MKPGLIAGCAGPPSLFRLFFNERGWCLRRLGSVRPDNASKVAIHSLDFDGLPQFLRTSG
jgi:hypothetical protein